MVRQLIKLKMTDRKYSDFNSLETGQTFSSLIITNLPLYFSVQIFLCAVAIYCVFLLFTNRYRTGARPGFNETKNVTDRGYVDRVDIGDLSENTPLRRKLNFGTLDDIPCRRSNTLESPSLAGPRATYVPTLHKFSVRNQEVYFQMIEFIFVEHAVTIERVKFAAVVTSLSHDQDIFEKVADIVRSPDPSKPCSVLRDSLIARCFSPAAVLTLLMLTTRFLLILPVHIITTPIGCCRYVYLSMGLATSSNYFPFLMREVLWNIPGVFVYLDDIFLMSQTEQEHRILLHRVFERLKLHGLAVNPNKCIVGVSSLRFLGHHVSKKVFNLFNPTLLPLLSTNDCAR